MKLYVTPTSPYARMTRILVIEKHLEDRVDIIGAQTRIPASPYYGINPSGRVPYLVRDDGVGMEDSVLICSYFDHLDGNPKFNLPASDEIWEIKRLEALARSLLDGLSVWGRELHRPEEDRSPTIIAHESARSGRMLDLWEKGVQHPLLLADLNMMQITIVCALQLEKLNTQFEWRAGHPNLRAWEVDLAKRRSIADTVPPPRT